MQTQPYIQYWITAQYTEKDVQKTLTTLRNNKAHGSDGIPGEAYEILSPWIAREITTIANHIKQGTQLPEDWAEGGN